MSPGRRNSYFGVFSSFFFLWRLSIHADVDRFPRNQYNPRLEENSILNKRA